ncbi:hypothetical protein [Nocardiopsis dassonvillei]|nr:hypothetical protein [Nocardiopsis dassonvillei]
MWAIDLRYMELAYERDLLAHYAHTGKSAVTLLKRAVVSMQKKAE